MLIIFGLVALAVLGVLWSVRIMADLQVIEVVETRLPSEQVRQIAGRAMKGWLSALADMAEGPGRIDRRFS